MPTAIGTATGIATGIGIGTGMRLGVIWLHEKRVVAVTPVFSFVSFFSLLFLFFHLFSSIRAPWHHR